MRLAEYAEYAALTEDLGISSTALKYYSRLEDLVSSLKSARKEIKYSNFTIEFQVAVLKDNELQEKLVGVKMNSFIAFIIQLFYENNRDKLLSEFDSMLDFARTLDERIKDYSDRSLFKEKLSKVITTNSNVGYDKLIIAICNLLGLAKKDSFDSYFGVLLKYKCLYNVDLTLINFDKDDLLESMAVCELYRQDLEWLQSILDGAFKISTSVLGTYDENTWIALRNTASRIGKEDFVIYWAKYYKEVGKNHYLFDKNSGNLSNTELLKVIKDNLLFYSVLNGGSLNSATKTLSLWCPECIKAELLSYAIKNNKEKFVNLLIDNGSVTLNLPENSLLLDKKIFSEIIDVNTLTADDLKAFCSMTTDWEKYTFIKTPLSVATLRLLYKHNTYTVEIANRLDPEVCYERLQELLNLDTLFAIKSINNYDALTSILNKESLHDFCGEQGLRVPEFTVVKLILAGVSLSVIKQMKNENDAVFALENLDFVKGDVLLEDAKENFFRNNKYFKYLVEQLKLIDYPEETALNFCTSGTAKYVYEFLINKQGIVGKKQEKVLRCILDAALNNNYFSMKYSTGDLAKEIDYPITEQQAFNWSSNNNMTLAVNDDKYTAYEADNMKEIFKIGEFPSGNVLNYKNGRYRDTLVSLFDSNKKIVAVKKNNHVVMKAIIMLTKKVDSDSVEPASISMKDCDQSNEDLVILVDSIFESNLSVMDYNNCLIVLAQLLNKKSRIMHCSLLFAEETLEHNKVLSTKSVSPSLFVSLSKNGKQLMQSIGGLCKHSLEGTFCKAKLLYID